MRFGQEDAMYIVHGVYLKNSLEKCSSLSFDIFLAGFPVMFYVCLHFLHAVFVLANFNISWKISRRTEVLSLVFAYVT